ncbi:peptide-methionine (S)-S-oxide reductase MsrA [bacterium]|nr:peptide-methionine (S)-S-oxide reductase MsrA [bacterium]
MKLTKLLGITGLILMAIGQSTPASAERCTFGGGCFWCLEAVFEDLKGVSSVTSGYAGGHVENPTYEQVCGGQTGHAEVVQIEFDPKVISYATLMKIFYTIHDPTTPNQQGADRGPQYRSIVLYDNNEQKKAAEEAKHTYQKDYKNPIVTEIVPLRKFYAAETYHQGYYKANGSKNPYCSMVISPKVQKMHHLFGDLLKK